MSSVASVARAAVSAAVVLVCAALSARGQAGHEMTN
jgi:hypothetical protein